ncbi:18S rRNA maturation protein [Physocladia obscura]|uniref:rRNA-processing protein EFG1 n=1 Tax=Physocladia obscura TaxID=109957 RepID=A0AAD5SUD7_9FUNG|nr:18S rRNA maturation protein [Physocladia obscura]
MEKSSSTTVQTDGNSKYKQIPKGKGTDGEGGIAGIKKRVRDTERLLRRGNLQATAKQELERRIKALNLELTIKTRELNEAEISTKYKYVKHVERTKVLRKITKLEKELAKLDNPKDTIKHDLESDLAQQRLNLAYIEFFPKDMKYVSLFATSESYSAATGKKRKATASAAGDDVDNFAVSGFISSEQIKAAVLDKIAEAMQNGEAKKSNFVLRMAHVFDEDQQEIYTVQAKLGRINKKPKISEKSIASHTKDAAGKQEEKTKRKKIVPKLKKDQYIPKHSKQTQNDNEGKSEDDNGQDDFFLFGNQEAESVPEDKDGFGNFDPVEFQVERAVKVKRPRDAGFKGNVKKGKNHKFK